MLMIDYMYIVPKVHGIDDVCPYSCTKKATIHLFSFTMNFFLLIDSYISQEGGGLFTSGTTNTALGDKNDEMLVAIAHVVVGATDLVPLGA